MTRITNRKITSDGVIYPSGLDVAKLPARIRDSVISAGWITDTPTPSATSGSPRHAAERDSVTSGSPRPAAGRGAGGEGLTDTADTAAKAPTGLESIDPDTRDLLIAANIHTRADLERYIADHGSLTKVRGIGRITAARIHDTLGIAD